MSTPTRDSAGAGAAPQWRDRKRYLWLLGLFVPLLPLAGLGLMQLTGVGAWMWLTPVVFLGVIPLVDFLAGKDSANPPEEITEALENDRYYRWVIYAYIPVQYAGFILAAWYFASDELSVWGKIGLAISVGIVAGLAINTAHEMGHKKEEHERWLSRVTLAPGFYGHFYIEHNRGHHVRVATPEDPASARMGESLYAFWPRTVFGSLKSAWELERKRYARKGQHPFRPGNGVLNAWAMSVVLWGALTIWLGWEILPYLAIQAVVGFTLLEIVNYMEHYGMLRRTVGDGNRQRYERVGPEHSWNSNNVATNVMLYHLQRHSDHHANPTRRYQALRDFKESPVLPTGYMGMIVVALFPPLFWRIMNPKVAAHYGGDLSLANVHPRKRDKLLRQFPLPVGSTGPGVHEDLSAVTLTDEVDAARCPGCSYTYVVAIGNEMEGFAAGTPWSEIPGNWCCPDCGVREKLDFVPVSANGY